MADAANKWAFLPVGIICTIVNFFLLNEDMDTYMALRGVCRSWRNATAGPAVDGTMVDGATDPLFMLSKWAMVTQSLRADAGVTLVNLSTGRFLSKRIPLLLRYFFLGATGGGLLVLGEREPPHLMRVFNPLTGAMARFNLPVVRSEVAAVAVTPSPLMVFISVRHEVLPTAVHGNLPSGCYQHDALRRQCAPDQLGIHYLHLPACRRRRRRNDTVRADYRHCHHHSSPIISWYQPFLSGGVRWGAPACD
ncbi:uncharacterized protein LOC112271690 [Brachypodium distachyon]|uniref:uncharacterized protein LOC112271690 n=1 Tax=Brachypodium distachyon TaxID=15368 RepID=UPI000D0CB698|nr:uncharacterized protein LOC112271690 [Brachypodium distachyon]|eukprot:XP_024317215.1 uncharacterized protein LOC112271690 [Brachypodium distachyon]